ncbi:potassium channel protein [Aporhodopirellula aestuarii]|uniref:Potassium channel protein n=1 Tax=Aporhodopirellula aestuarii TaxID=2950107 RepID=A0ABT0U019_9BACT|nr:potassium channel protein [Aporhodopirellula aestuarii]MCM2370213.1 potassium channel protein [Aporhodopirellula aestuarii]
MLIHTRIAVLTAPLMFSLAVVFLICQAVLIVIWVDVPSIREKTVATGVAMTEKLDRGDAETALVADDNAAAFSLGPASPTQVWLESLAIGAMGLIWPIVVLESIYHWIIRPKTWATRWFHLHSLVFCICPSLRMCAKSAEMHGYLWLPGLGWQRPNRRLRRRLEQHFSVPMIGIAMLILPVLIVEFMLKDQVARYQWLRVSLHVGTGVIWFAFAAEFILMVSIAEKKIDYIRRHWVDIAIIALPFFSFLRSMQAMRGTRLAKLAKLPQLTKLARAYRLRGMVLKAFRALVLLDVSTRLFRKTPEKQLKRLREELVVTQREARLIRLLIARLEREIATRDTDSDPEDSRDEENSPDPSGVSDGEVSGFDEKLELPDRLDKRMLDA